MAQKDYKFRQVSGRNISVEFRFMPGKRISTGTIDMVEAVRFAEDYIRNDGRAVSKGMTLQRFAKDIFKPSDPYGIRARNDARHLDYSAAYYDQHQGRVDNHILPKFGGYLLDAISDVMIEDFILSLQSVKGGPLADDSRNKVLMCFRIILQEAKRQGLVKTNVANDVHMINAINKPSRTILPEELSKLFPADRLLLLHIWDSLMWAGYFMILRDTGFRPGEAAALQKKNFLPRVHGVYSRQSVSFRTRTVQSSIKTSRKGQNYKVGILTGQTCQVLHELAEDMRDDDFFFHIGGRLIGPETSNKHLKASAKKAGIHLDGRTQYSFRHAFETDLAGKVESKLLLELMAHTSYHREYDHRTPEHILEQLQPVRAILEDRGKDST